MKIMIEFDPTIATVKVMRPTSVEGEVLSQAVAEPAVEGAALDAGECSGVVVEQNPSDVPPSAINAGMSTASGSPPSPHRDTFGLFNGASQGEEGLDAGSPKS